MNCDGRRKLSLRGKFLGSLEKKKMIDEREESFDEEDEKEGKEIILKGERKRDGKRSYL